MKIANRFNTVNVKVLFTRAAMIAVAAGAVFMAAPQKAAAQVSFGVEFGRPAYRRPVYIAPAPVYVRPYAPIYAGPGYGYAYDRNQFAREEFNRHEAWERHQEWDRRNDFDRRDRR